MKHVILVLCLIAIAAGPALADPPDRPCARRFTIEFAETFDGGSNEGAWTFGNEFDRILSTGGNPRAFLHNMLLDTFAPRARTTPGVESPFTGNYRERGVFRIGADFKTFSVQFSGEGRTLSFMLVNFNGTPEDPGDDIFVFFVGEKPIPLPDSNARRGWQSYDFHVPSDSLTVPFPRSQAEGEPGWVVAQGDLFTPPPDPDAAWNQVMQRVDQVIFWYQDPRLFAIFQLWNVGMDNPRVATCTGGGD